MCLSDSLRSSGRSFRTLPLFLQKVIFSLRNYVILRQNSDCWFVAALSERAEFYAYLIIYKGVNDVPDQIDLQSPWPPSSLTSMDNGYRSSSLSYMVSLGFNYVVNKCASDKNQKESVWPFLYGLTSMVWLIDDQIDPLLCLKKVS